MIHTKFFSLKKIKLYFLLPFMICFVSPLTFYWGNSEQLSFTIIDILIPATCLFLISGSILYLLSLIVKKNKFLADCYNGFVLGVGISIWIQSQIFAWNFGPLDGSKIPWQNWHFQMLLEAFIWGGMVVFFILLFRAQKQKVIQSLATLAFFCGILSIISSYFLSPPYKQVTSSKTSYESIFRFHPERNVLVIILDYFHAGAFEYILANYPDETTFLDGFTYYDNAISSHPNTHEAIPALFTASEYTNQKPYKTFINNVYSKHDFRQSLKEKNWHCDSLIPTAGSNEFITNGIDIAKLISSTENESRKWWVDYLVYGFFRGAPTAAKKFFYNDGEWLSEKLISSSTGISPADHANPVEFTELFPKNIQTDNDLPTFKSFHLYLPHLPLTVNENLEYERMTGSEGYIRQCRGALKLAKRIIEVLKQNDIFDTAEIFIVADHGAREFNLFSAAETQKAKVPIQVPNSARILFLHKAPNTTGPLKTFSTSLTLKDLPCFIPELQQEARCIDSKSTGSTGPRRFYYFNANWPIMLPYHRNMVEFVLDGKAADIDAWSYGKNIYGNGSIQNITNETDPFAENVVRVRLNTPIYFRSDSGFSIKMPFLTTGWSGQEASLRWTKGSVAKMLIYINEYKAGDLTLKLRALPYLGGGLKHQKINLVINNTAIISWEMSKEDWYEARIPSSLLNDKKLDISFFISNPTSPSETGESSDTRKLGMAIREMTFYNSDVYLKSLSFNKELNEPIFFTKTNDPIVFLGSGWSNQEDTHRWTEGPEASLRVNIPDAKNKNLLLRMDAGPYLGGGLKHQTVGVMVNDHPVTTWEMADRKWYEAQIPSSVVGDGLLNISFQISNPTAPCEVNESKDCRKLGIAGREIVIEEMPSP